LVHLQGTVNSMRAISVLRNSLRALPDRAKLCDQ
jgi:hypothetical protein